MAWKRDSHNFSEPDQSDVDTHKLFRPLLLCLRGLGLLDRLSISSQNAKTNHCKKAGFSVFRCCRLGYLVAVWIWTTIVTINVFFLGISDDDVNIQHGNMVIKLLEQMPFGFIAIRSTLLLTIFLNNTSHILQGIESCETVRLHLCQLGGLVTFERYQYSPLVYIISSFVVIILFEAYEWNVWFNVHDGMTQIWDFKPFPFTLIQLYYACFWWAFISIPFLLSQITLCVPLLFAYILRRFAKFVNKELSYLAKRASDEKTVAVEMDLLADRVTHLRTAYFHISQLNVQLDKTVNQMLLVQFLCDIIIMFGFMGLLVNSKDQVHNKDPKQRIATLEWTFYIPASITWFCYFLFYFSFPLIHLANESERTHSLIHTLTFSSATLFQRKFKDLSIFLSETFGTPLSFSGGHFYHINRHYIVTICALTASYLTVLTEILDRYYGTEDLKDHIVNLTNIVKNMSGLPVDSVDSVVH